MTSAPQSPPDETAPSKPLPSLREQLLEKRGTIFALLFGVTGCLGLPLLWMSPRFSRTEKIVWSVIVVLYTLLLIGGTAAVLWWSYSQIVRALA
ncbi:MAG: hypothetical protein KatS3mg111_0433 [Pirellulaceae bacterium]|nr:MAG: hypothetical protein KatS3mg111_0433 [Pirellulaceae bacterium]